MISVNIHDVKTRLSELVKAVEEQGETVILQRHGKPVAEIRGYRQSDNGTLRDLTPDPNLRPIFSPGYDPAKPLSEEEWPGITK